MTTILLAEDHHVVRQAFKVLLEEDPDWLVVGEAANGLDTVALAEQLHPASAHFWAYVLDTSSRLSDAWNQWPGGHTAGHSTITGIPGRRRVPSNF